MCATKLQQRPRQARERPVESEEEDEGSAKKSRVGRGLPSRTSEDVVEGRGLPSRIADSTGQKRKEAATTTTTTTHTRAKAKAADPVGSKRKPSKGAEGTQSPVKAKMAEPTGEKRKADSDAEEEVQGSPMRSRLEEDEDMLSRLSRVTAFEVLQLHTISSLATDSEKLVMETMDLGGLDIDSVANRKKITEWVRKRKPAFIVGSPQCRTNEYIQWCCDLYKLQAQEGR